MKLRVTTGILVTAFWAGQVWAAEGAPAHDRLTLMASGSTLTDADDGAGAAIGWLHNFRSGAIVGLGAEYQTIADSEWKFGSLSFAMGRGQANSRTNFYADIHEGSGNDDTHSYDYSVVAAGFYQNVTRQLSIQLEDKQIDIDTTHGNLPKLGAQFLWSPTLLTGVSYAHSVSGDLGTRLWSLRIDRFGKKVNLIAGGATGKASPAVVDLQGIRTPGVTLHEGFVGIAKPFSRVDLTLLGDYIKIAGTERFTVTLNGTIRLGESPR